MLEELLKGVKSAALGGHERPDGDCVGSSMGLYLYLKKYYPQIRADIYLEEIPKPYRFILDTREIKSEAPKGKIYDLFICLDCGGAGRLGFSEELFDKAKKTFIIDHHVGSLPFSEGNYVNAKASSTCELVYRLMEKERITREIAEALYLGIVHDTGVFRYSCAAPSTFLAAADLLSKGVDAPALIDSTFYEKTYGQNRILGQALLNGRLYLGGKCIVSVISKREMEDFGVEKTELDGIVNQLGATRGVETSVFMYELSKDTYKVSLRSKKIIDVNETAAHFGGGGHIRAAGCTAKGEPREIIKRLLKELETQFEEADKEGNYGMRNFECI